MLRLPSGVSLRGGVHRAAICAAIRDLRSSPLGGGSDHLLDFAPPGNVLANLNFDANLVGWTFSDPAAAHHTADADGAPSSGSAIIRVSAQVESARQCLGAAALAGLDGLAGLRGRVRIADHGPTTVEVEALLTFYAGTDCLGAELLSAGSAAAVGDSGSHWLALGVETAILTGAVSVAAGFRATPIGAGADSDVEIDRGLLANTVLFADGFESGDSSAWGQTLPECGQHPHPRRPARKNSLALLESRSGPTIMTRGRRERAESEMMTTRKRGGTR